jgi:hypothetical protein
MLTILPQTIPKFICDKCHFLTHNKKDYNRHLLTRKHLDVDKMLTNSPNFSSITPHQLCYCKCGKEYKHRQSLSIHKKLCTKTNHFEPVTNNNTNTNITPELIIEIIKQNQEFKNLLVEQNKSIIELSKNTTTTNNSNTVNNNSHNKTFNLHFFLNDTCKNAMNLTDFVRSLQIDLTDLESVGELGFVNGLSKLIINGLNDLEECERPVHCSDLKRESIYVKDDNKWEKEDADNTKMKKALKQIAHKNIKMLPVWKIKNPDCKRSESHLSDKYSHMVIEAMGGSGDNDEEKANKIIRKIAKEVTIKKQI